MFCFLAGSMITVSATALGVWFKFPMPGLNDIYPNSGGWVVGVLAIGILISIVAAFGYDIVSKFANIAAPWMVLVFLAFGIIGLRQFIEVTGTQVNSAGDLWNLCTTSIWKGGEPLPGQIKFTFWHVTFFAWFCNMAMHVGMSDLSVFRFARKSWYGLASASGMYVGHFMAWLAASILYALQLQINPENTNVLPGPMAYSACGIAGLICVIIAGWTTANPTIYRAGLAFQAIFPKASRFWVTFGTGILATCAAMFPAIAMKLLGFVALYGLILMPMGAVIFIDFWVLEKIGLKSNYAEFRKTKWNLAPLIAWAATFVICICLVMSGNQYFQIYFVSLPGWFIAVILYTVCSYVIQKEVYRTPQFKLAAQTFSWLALLGILLPGFLFIKGSVSLNQVRLLMTASTVLWFIAASLWIGLPECREDPLDNKEADQPTDLEGSVEA
jgi:purine-cytosine permease-like protein